MSNTSGYMEFFKEQNLILEVILPTLSRYDRAEKIGALWQHLTLEQKQPYREKAKKVTIQQQKNNKDDNSQINKKQ